eukprot:gene5733-10987_t
MKNVTLTVLIKEIENSILCPGLDLTVPTQEGSKSDVKMHMVPKIPSTFTEHSQPLLQDEFMRAIGCHILLDETSPVPCSECKTKFQYEMKLLSRKQNLTNTPAKLKAPLSATNPQRIILALQENRLQCKQLQVKLQEMKNENENARHSEASTTSESNSSSFVVESIVTEMENDNHEDEGVGKPQCDDEGQIDDGSHKDEANDDVGNMEVIDGMENAGIAKDDLTCINLPRKRSKNTEAKR